MRLWWKTYATTDDRLQLVFLSKNTTLIALFPFYVRSGNTLCFVGTGEAEADSVCSEYVDILIADDIDEQLHNEVHEEYLRYICATPKSLFCNVFSDSNVSNLIMRNTNRLHTVKNNAGLRYALTLPSDNGVFYDRLKPGFRRQLRSKRRRFSLVDGRIISADDENSRSWLFKRLVELHNNRWQGVGEQGAFSSGTFRDFHEKYSQNALASSQLYLTGLELDGAIIGVIYCFDYAGTRFFYQMGINRDSYPTFSLGTILHSYAIEDAIVRGLRTYDFMKGAIKGSYKRHYGCETTTLVNLTIASTTLSKASLQLIEKLRLAKRILSQFS